MKISRIVAKGLLICLCLVNINSAFVFAQENINDTVATDTDSPRYVETGYKYMTINGVCYRRLWNYTAGEWVDPAWTRCPASSHNH